MGREVPGVQVLLRKSSGQKIVNLAVGLHQFAVDVDGCCANGCTKQAIRRMVAAAWHTGVPSRGASKHCCVRRHPSVGAVNNARLALVGDAVLDVCALTDAYDAASDCGTLSVEGGVPILL